MCTWQMLPATSVVIMSQMGGSDAGMSEHDDVVLSDDVIRITMEFTGLPRHQVMKLHNDGDPTAVMIMAQLLP